VALVLIKELLLRSTKPGLGVNTGVWLPEVCRMIGLQKWIYSRTVSGIKIDLIMGEGSTIILI
jgi:hypothetical protein